MIGKIEKSREAVDIANVKGKYTELMGMAILGEDPDKSGSDIERAGNPGSYTYSVAVPLKQTSDGWQTNLPLTIAGVESESGRGENAPDDHAWSGTPVSNGSCIISYSESTGVTFNWGGAKIVYDTSNSIAKYVLSEVKKDLTSYISANSSEYSNVFKKNYDYTLTTKIELPDGKKVDLVIYNRNYNDYIDIKTRMVENTASLIYNRDTKQMSTIIYFDGTDYTSWSLTDQRWLDNRYIGK